MLMVAKQDIALIGKTTDNCVCWQTKNLLKLCALYIIEKNTGLVNRFASVKKKKVHTT